MVDSDIWAVVPVKDFKDAKSRLAAVLDAEERKQLSRTMVQDVLTAIAGVECLAGAVMVTRDQEAAEIAASFGARVFFEAENRGPTEAVTYAVRRLASEGRSGMISIPGDVPLVTANEINHLLNNHGSEPAVTLCPAWDGDGSNAIVCTPPDAIPLSYGEASFSCHLETAKRLGIEARVIKLPGLGLDIDQPDDLLAFVREPSQTRTAHYLQQIGITTRLNGEILLRSNA